MFPEKPIPPHENKSISINGDVRDSTVIIGDNNIVNQTIIQKFFNIFKSDSETLEQRNRRILLNHVENAWIKGVLDASLHGAAMLELGIKQDPEAVTKYPWAIKKGATNETLPAGASMLEIFDSIGIGRSLLILGAPGSGKTTMLLELARGLIARAREDVTQPIPMVFNLASWTEKLTLADWLAQELNNLYSVPRKTAPDWVKGNKLLLLLDGLDEVRQESRARCVEAINEFRKQNGLTSLTVCSRSQDYADLKAKLAFEGAIEVQPLTQGQIAEFFNRFGDEMVGIRQALENDSALREMAETPLFLNIMLVAYRDKQDVEILVSGDEKVQRKHLFDIYIKHMFGRPRLKKTDIKEQHILHWLSWLSSKMIKHYQIPFLIENMTSFWVNEKIRFQKFRPIYIFGSSFLFFGPIGSIITLFTTLIFGEELGLTSLVGYLLFGFLGGIAWGTALNIVIANRDLKTENTANKSGLFLTSQKTNESEMVDGLNWNWKEGGKGMVFGGLGGGFLGLCINLVFSVGLDLLLIYFLLFFIFGLALGVAWGGLKGLVILPVAQTTYPGQRLFLSAKNSVLVFFMFWFFFSLAFEVIFILFFSLFFGFEFMLTLGWRFVLVGSVYTALMVALIFGWMYGGYAVVRNYSLRFILSRNNLLPWRLVPFLDHCVDLIFLRRVGGGYIFIHRLLMEHFAEMYVETPTSKGSK